MNVNMISWEVFVFAFLNLIAGFAAVINLKSTLQLVHTKHMAIKPNAVWLLIIPGVNLVSQFFIFRKVSISLYNEFKAQKWNTKPVVASYHLAMIMGVCSILMFLPVNGFFYWFCFTLFFFAYWIGIFILKNFILRQKKKIQL